VLLDIRAARQQIHQQDRSDADSKQSQRSHVDGKQALEKPVPQSMIVFLCPTRRVSHDYT
jgi:hypothetical protein